MKRLPESLEEEKNLAICRLNDKCSLRDRLGFCGLKTEKCNQKATMFAELDVETGEDNLLTVIWVTPYEQHFIQYLF